MARQKIEIDWNLLDELLKAQCTFEQCASALGVSHNTLRSRIKQKKKMSFQEYKESVAPAGLADLLRAQFRVAIKNGDSRMLVHLGKNYLGQTDKIENNVNVKEHNINFAEISTEELKQILGGGDDAET